METILRIGLSNALLAIPLAALAATVGRFCRRPALAHGLWLLVLLKLLTPPIRDIPIMLPSAGPLPSGPVLVPKVEESSEPAMEIESELVVTPVAANSKDTDPWAELDELEALAAAAKHAAAPLEIAEPPQAAPEAEPYALGSPAVSTAGSTLPWTSILVGTWATGSLVWLGLTIYRVHRFRGMLRSARPAAKTIVEHIQTLSGVLGLKQCPSVEMIPGRLSPMLWALGGRPRLLLPSGLWKRLQPAQRSTLVVHELAHLRRRDPWVRGLELLVTGLYWWHPVVWWACRALREAEEQCCDAWVTWALPDDAKTYATALVETVDFLSETQTVLPVAASGIGHVHDLRRRLTMILRGTTPRTLSGAGWGVLLALAALVLPVSTRAQDRNDGPAADRQPDDQVVQESGRREGGTSGGEQNDGELRNAQRAVDSLKQQVDRIQKELRLATLRLELARAQAEERRGSQPTPGDGNLPERRGAARSPAGAGSRAGITPAELDRRLTVVDRKLDLLIEEIRGLRQQVGPRGGRMGGAMFGGGAGMGAGGPAMGGGGGGIRMAPGGGAMPGMGGMGGNRTRPRPGGPVPAFDDSLPPGVAPTSVDGLPRPPEPATAPVQPPSISGPPGAPPPPAAPSDATHTPTPRLPSPTAPASVPVEPPAGGLPPLAPSGAPRLPPPPAPTPAPTAPVAATPGGAKAPTP